MSQRMYAGIATVKVKAPKGYKPNTLTYKFGIFSETKSQKLIRSIQEELSESICSRLKENNPDVELTATTTVDLTPVLGFKTY